MCYNSRSDARLFAIPSGSLNPPQDNGFGNTTKGVSDQVLDYFLSSSFERVNAALRQHHTLPLTTVPGIVKRCELVLTNYDCLMYQGMPPEKIGNISKEYDSITSKGGELDRLRDGTLQLDTPSNQIDSSPTYSGPQCVSVSSPSIQFYTDYSGRRVDIV